MLGYQGLSPASGSRVRREALLLTAACVWLLNALDRRPEDGPSLKSLMGAVLPLTHEDDHLLLAHSHCGLGDDQPDNEFELNTGAPHYPYGVIFLRRIVFGQDNFAPRMICGGGRFISKNAVLYLFGESEEDLRQRCLGSAEFLQS